MCGTLDFRWDPNRSETGHFPAFPGSGIPTRSRLVRMTHPQVRPAAGDEQAQGFELVRFAQSLAGAASLEQLERRFLAGFGRLFGVPDVRLDSSTQ